MVMPCRDRGKSFNGFLAGFIPNSNDSNECHECPSELGESPTRFGQEQYLYHSKLGERPMEFGQEQYLYQPK